MEEEQTTQAASAAKPPGMPPGKGGAACRASEGPLPLGEGCGAGGGEVLAAGGGVGVNGPVPGALGGAAGGPVPGMVPGIQAPPLAPPRKPVALPPPQGRPGTGETTLLIPAGVEPGDALDWAIVIAIGVTAEMALLWGAACVGLWRRRIELVRAGGRPGGLSRG